MYFVAEQTPTDAPAWFKEMQRAWRTEVTQEKEFDIMPELDTFIGNDPDRAAFLLAALEQVPLQLQRWPDAVPAAERARIGLHGITKEAYISPYPVVEILKNVEDLQKLLLDTPRGT
jgi:hypothetical protein